MSDEDRTLLVRARTGDRDAFDRLVLHFLERTLHIAMRMLGNREDAEDVVQETFARAHLRLAEFQGDSSFGTWVTRIAIRLCIDQLRARKRRSLETASAPERLDAEPSREPDPQHWVEQQETRRRLEQALQALPQRLGSAFVLRVLQGLEYEEIANILGAQVRSVRIYVCEARKHLAAALLNPHDKEEP